jgi:hypothetical protein
VSALGDWIAIRQHGALWGEAVMRQRAPLPGWAILVSVIAGLIAAIYLLIALPLPTHMGRTRSVVVLGK